MHQTRYHRGHVVLSSSDFAVVAAGASAVTAPWWGPLVEWLPHIAQGVIVTGTVIFVIARAVNEVAKFVRESRRDQE